MKIRENYDSLIEAWMITSNALDIIKHIMLDNRDCSRETIEAFYKVLQACNEWNEEIKQIK